jgi:hypothetical protein
LSSYPWVFFFSSVALSLSLAIVSFSSHAISFSSHAINWIFICCSRITAWSRAEDLEDSLSVVAVREARVESLSLARRAFASLEFRRDYSVACQAAFSSAKARSATDRTTSSLDNTFLAMQSRLQIQKYHEVRKGIIGLKQ